MNMKRLFTMLLVLLLGFTLVACKKDTGGNDNDNGDNDNGDKDNGDDDDDDDDNGHTTPPTEIVIMHGAVNEVDPRREDFSGRDRADRIALHEQVEKEMNVKIVYRQYPADAPWGPYRQEAIISWHAAGQPRADIYWLTTIWLKEIVDNNAIVPLDNWYNQYGNAHETAKTVSAYKGQHWGTAPEPFRGENGLFINTALLAEIGIADPVDLWNNGEWTFSRFKSWVAEAQNALGNDQYALASVPSNYAKHLIPLNGGKIVDDVIGMVTFNNPRAHEVYDILLELKAIGAFEPSPEYDSGSEDWANGNALIHPGSLWLVRAENRWGTFDFVKNGDIGVVPFPMPDGASKDSYIQPLAGEAIYTVATNSANKAKEELAFEVWNRIQLWDTEEQLERAFQNRLANIFDEQKHIDVMLEISSKVYLDINEQLGIPAFGSSSWQINVNSGIAEGSVRARMEQILPIYEAALLEYLS